MGSEENEPQIKAPRVTPLEGVSTYAPSRAYVSLTCTNSLKQDYLLGTSFQGGKIFQYLPRQIQDVVGHIHLPTLSQLDLLQSIDQQSIQWSHFVLLRSL